MEFSDLYRSLSGIILPSLIFLTKEETHVLSEPCSIGKMTGNLVAVSLSFRASVPFFFFFSIRR